MISQGFTKLHNQFHKTVAPARAKEFEDKNQGKSPGTPEKLKTKCECHESQVQASPKMSWNILDVLGSCEEVKTEHAVAH